MDWSASGIRNTFEYELIDPFDLSFSLGYLDGVTGCTITESYRGEYRASACLELDGAELPINALVRVWHIAELDGEIYRHVLGTFMQELNPDMDYAYGRRYGSVPLQSTLLRLGTDRRAGDMAVPKSTAVVPYFERIVSNAGGTSYTSPAFDRSKTFSKGRVWACSESVLSECHRCADAVGGRVETDEMGRVSLVPYQIPSSRAVSHEFQSGDASPVLVGVKTANAEVVNKVVVSYKHDDETYYAVSQVDASHPWHWRKIGRHVAAEYTENSLDLGENPTAEQIKAALQAMADSRLAALSKALRTWGATLLYAPVSCGEVITLPYNDSPDSDGLMIKGMVTQREIECDATMLMSLTIEEVA